ncbi:PDZ domain-containing protein [Pseudomonas sp. EA_35y_Pfl2_R111]|uniref:PDZ domain-containing protein n=1 Tax=Pseudomonas sp. EA_35y_Pfl2_R111 TaxID=3088689 RepID=UPI0030DD4EEA
MKIIQTICLALAASSLTGCMIAAVNGMVADAYTSAETPESLGIAPANYRGKSCLELAVDRENAEYLSNHIGEYQDYVQKQGRWAKASVEQVERETGCLPGTTGQQAGVIDYVLKHPESLKELELKLPPGGLEYIKAGGKLPANTSSTPTISPVPPPASAPQTVGSRWGATTPEGLPQTSLDQWIAKETPENYQGRSCEYLQRAFALSESMEASAEIEVRTWGASKKRVISGVLAGRECPAFSPPIGGRLGAVIGPIDPIKAARLGMPFTGSSIEQVVPSSPAEHAGLKFADVVVAVGTTPISDHIELLIALSKISPGSTALLKVWRKGAYVNVPVMLGSPAISQADLQSATAKSVASGLKEYCYIYMASDAYEVNPDVLSLVFQDSQANGSQGSQVATIKKFHQKVAQMQPGVWRDYKVNDLLCHSSSGHCSVTASGMFGPKQTTTLRCFDSLDAATSALSSDRSADPTAKVIQP